MWSPEATAIMRRIVPAADADILIYNAPMERPRDRIFIKQLSKRKCRPNLLMILVTNGGDPDAAYRIARALQAHYKKFTVCVSGICKSSGTLLLLGANELAFSENGELGPLDIQMAKKDELWESESGLTVMTRRANMQQEAKPFWNSQQLRELLRQQMEMFRRTAKPDPQQLEDEGNRTRTGSEPIPDRTSLNSSDKSSSTSSPTTRTRTKQ